MAKQSAKKGRRRAAVEAPDEKVKVVATGAKRSTQSLVDEEIGIPQELAVMPIRNMVIFPGTIAPLAVSREPSRRLLNDVLPGERLVATVCQRSSQTDEPAPEDLYTVGTAVHVLKLLRLEDSSQGVIVQGLRRIRIVEWTAREPYLKARIEILQEQDQTDRETEALVVNVREVARRVIDLSPHVPDEAAGIMASIERPGQLADFLAGNLRLDLPIRQELLEEPDVNRRLRRIAQELARQSDILELSEKIQSQVRSNIDQTQRQYYLREQLKAIQRELGESDGDDDVDELRRRIDEAQMPQDARTEAARELGRLRRIPSASPEHNITRTYLEVLSELPWQKATQDNLDVAHAREILDEDHYDLDKIKRRVLEYLSVRKLAPASRGPILCFLGPPGVGKTSLGQSIARALGRKFIRMSLGGVRDEAELRGHRRTYIGAMPGRIVQEIRRAGTNNPVFMLDELDKVGADFRGDPSSALLEILDPAQNSTFQDNYLGVPMDLSKVLFIGTANQIGPVPPALRDRLEIIELSGYTRPQKLQIARRYLVPRQLRENGLTERKAKWKEPAILKIIDNYTREPGVRELERQIGSVCRAVAAMIASGEARSRTITAALVEGTLGPRQYEDEVALRTSVPGVATGLAYTPAGGKILFIEAAGFAGKGGLTLTGQIGDVMRESAQAALSLVRSRAEQLGLETRVFSERDLHIHVPAGAVPKDGPSAGVAVTVAITSLLQGRPVRSDVAMTGEITLRGLVLPVGGIKEKVLAAHQAGIGTVILPARNERDLVDVPQDARESLQFVFAHDIDDVLKVALAPAAGRRSR